MIYWIGITTEQKVVGDHTYPERMITRSGYNGKNQLPESTDLLIRQVSKAHYEECRSYVLSQDQYAVWESDAEQSGDGTWSATLTAHDYPEEV